MSGGSCQKSGKSLQQLNEEAYGVFFCFVVIKVIFARALACACLVHLCSVQVLRKGGRRGLPARSEGCLSALAAARTKKKIPSGTKVLEKSCTLSILTSASGRKMDNVYSYPICFKCRAMMLLAKYTGIVGLVGSARTFPDSGLSIAFCSSVANLFLSCDCATYTKCYQDYSIPVVNVYLQGIKNASALQRIQ